jgi:hypothetical protein
MKTYEVVVAVDVPLFKTVTVPADTRDEAVAVVQRRIAAEEFSDEDISAAISAYQCGHDDIDWTVGHPDDIEVNIVHTEDTRQ